MRQKERSSTVKSRVATRITMAVVIAATASGQTNANLPTGRCGAYGDPPPRDGGGIQDRVHFCELNRKSRSSKRRC